MTDEPVVVEVHQGTWHVHMDGNADVYTHVCTGHRNFVRRLQCWTCGLDGDCWHVQHRPCRCGQDLPCSSCMAELEIEAMNATSPRVSGH